MLHIVVMTFAALAIFFATVVNMALKKENQKLSIIIVIVAAVIGAFFYSYGYGVKIENDFIVLARTVLSVSGMFIGRWDFTNVDDTELFTNPVIYLVFLIVHFLALYSLANVVMMKGYCCFTEMISPSYSVCQRNPFSSPIVCVRVGKTARSLPRFFLSRTRRITLFSQILNVMAGLTEQILQPDIREPVFFVPWAYGKVTTTGRSLSTHSHAKKI